MTHMEALEIAAMLSIPLAFAFVIGFCFGVTVKR